jgi:hypothetical protein
MAPLVAKYGAAAVWEVGLRVNKFPANWCQTGTEKLAIEKVLASMPEEELARMSKKK